MQPAQFLIILCVAWQKVIKVFDGRILGVDFCLIKHSLSQWPNSCCSFISLSFALSYRLSLVVSADTILSANWPPGVLLTQSFACTLSVVGVSDKAGWFLLCWAASIHMSYRTEWGWSFYKLHNHILLNVLPQNSGRGMIRIHTDSLAEMLSLVMWVGNQIPPQNSIYINTVSVLDFCVHDTRAH